MEILLPLRLWSSARVLRHATFSSVSTRLIARSFHLASLLSNESANEKSLPLQKNTIESATASTSSYNALMTLAKKRPQLSSREQFSLVLKEFMAREKHRRGHVTFINMAMERMEEFGLEKDLLTYNRLLDILPKNRYHPKRLLDVIWPRPLPQVELALELLTRMEDNYVWPDGATYSLLVQIFGKHGLPVQKCERMIYWSERYKDADPYWIEGELPKDRVKLSKLALKRIVSNEGHMVEHKVRDFGAKLIYVIYLYVYPLVTLSSTFER